MSEKERGIPTWYAWVTIVAGLLIIIAYQAMILADRREPGSWVPTYPQAYFSAHDVAPYPNLRDAEQGYAGPSDNWAYGYTMLAKTDDEPHEVVDFYRKQYPKANVVFKPHQVEIEAKTARGDALHIYVKGHEVYYWTSVKIRRD